MVLVDHQPMTLRMLFAAAAADPRAPLSAAMRGAILASLQRPAWVPDPQAIPQTWGLVEAWYAGVQGKSRQEVDTRIRRSDGEATTTAGALGELACLATWEPLVEGALSGGLVRGEKRWLT